MHEFEHYCLIDPVSSSIFQSCLIVDATFYQCFLIIFVSCDDSLVKCLC